MNSTLKRRLRRFWGIALLALSPLFFWQRGDAAANTLWVNDDASVYSWPGTNCDKVAYATIQAAINAAGAGDTIRVCPGIYNENLLVNKRYLSIISTSGVNVTTIKAHLNQPVVQVLSPNFTLEGFSLFPEGFAKQDIGVNVAIEGTSNAQIVGNIITRGRIGINVGCSSRASSIYRNIVRGQSEIGINVDTCEIDNLPGTSDNSVHHNHVCGGMKPYSIAVGGGQGTDNHIHHNMAQWIRIAGTGNQAHDNTAE